MRKRLFIPALAVLCAGAFTSCEKTSLSDENKNMVTQEEKALIASAGFNGNWAEKTSNGSFLIEDDILLTRDQLQKMAGVAPTYNLIVGNEEHYRTTNLVTVSGSTRTITVSMSSGFPTYYYTALDAALARYNGYGLTIKFQRVNSGGEINITAANLGRTLGGGCILGQSSGFPSGGNPAPGFTLSNSKCATQYINNQTKADEVIAHEMGHTIGFRHTDYMNRISCGSNSNEGDAGVGAIHISGTITTVTSGNYNSWMMACTNGDNSFSSEDQLALTTVY